MPHWPSPFQISLPKLCRFAGKYQKQRVVDTCQFANFSPSYRKFSPIAIDARIGWQRAQENSEPSENAEDAMKIINKQWIYQEEVLYYVARNVMEISLNGEQIILNREQHSW
jgi:hypothetical protein